MTSTKVPEKKDEEVSCNTKRCNDEDLSFVECLSEYNQVDFSNYSDTTNSQSNQTDHNGFSRSVRGLITGGKTGNINSVENDKRSNSLNRKTTKPEPGTTHKPTESLLASKIIKIIPKEVFDSPILKRLTENAKPSAVDDALTPLGKMRTVHIVEVNNNSSSTGL